MLGHFRSIARGQGLRPGHRVLRARAGLLVALAAALLAACGGLGGGAAQDARTPAPDAYVVRNGDTLYSIATRFALDYRDVARWNRLGDGSLIYPGQKLKLRPPAAARAVAGAPAGGQALPDDAPPVKGWQWPAAGDVVLGFRQSTWTASGILIAGRFGEPVQAAADGEVVYSGSGLTGYGQLVIIRHNPSWLSAYGHNEELLVREGDRVRAGQQIARMGAGAGRGAALHFEIRRDGEPLDPLRFLPPRR